MIKKIICIVFVILLITISPISTYLKYDNNVYATTTFLQDVESDMFKQIIITSLISYGLVYNTSNGGQSVISQFEEVLKNFDASYKSPNDPEGPNLGQIVKTMLKGVVIWVTADGLYKNLIEIPPLFKELVKTFVDTNYDVGDNSLGVDYQTLSTVYGYIFFDLNSYGTKSVSLYNKDGVGITATATVFFDNDLKRDRITLSCIFSDGTFLSQTGNHSLQQTCVININQNEVSVSNGSFSVMKTYNSLKDNIVVVQPVPDNLIIGTPNIVDNPNYDWINPQTGKREIGIPLSFDTMGNIITDTNGIKSPSTTVYDWVGTTPSDIVNSNLTGDVKEEIPPVVEPVVEPPAEDNTISTPDDFNTPNQRALYQMKFPFSLPWDIKAIFTLIRAMPLAPRFEIDILPTSLKTKIGITKDTKFVFDMAQFPLVPKVTRFFTFISFCLTLIFVTRLIIKS